MSDDAPELGVVVYAVHKVEPELDRSRIAGMVTAVAPTSGQLSWLARHLAQAPDCLVSGASTVPPLAAALIRALRAAGAIHVMEPRCAACSRARRLRHRMGEGRICNACFAKRNAQRCCRCGRIRPVAARSPHGPVCNRCYKQDPTRWEPCQGCGRRRVVCTRGPDGPRCQRCSPRPTAACTGCGRHRPVQAVLLGGPVCATCYDHAGAARPCQRCGTDGRHYTAGTCAACVLDERVTALLTGPDGNISPALRPLRRVLLEVDQPRSTLIWLCRSQGASLLAAIAAGELALTHQALDRQPQTPTLHFLRELLIAAGVLPWRASSLQRLRCWLDGLLAGAPPQHARLVRQFATWSVLRRLQPKAEQDRLTARILSRARAELRQATCFLAWLDKHATTLAALRQADLDLWLTSGPRSRIDVRAFLRWAKACDLTGDVTVPAPCRPRPTVPLDDDERWALVERLLHDQALDLPLRVAGLFVLLYGQPLTRILRLTVDHVRRADGQVAVHFGRTDLVLPEPLAALVNDLLDQPSGASLARRPGTRWLFVGWTPGRPLSAQTMGRRLVGAGIHSRPARQAAVLQLAAEVPGPILADLLDLHPRTAVAWIRAASGDWAAYAAGKAERPYLPNE